MGLITFLNGDTMPVLGLGTWKLDRDKAGRVVREAINIGYRHFDCARIYGNEKEIGKALNDAMAAGDVRREDLWITSKLWNDSHARHQVKPAIQNTLKDLKLDYLDLYLVHWPIALKRGVAFPESHKDFLPIGQRPLEKTWAGMEEAMLTGHTRHIGVSNFNIEKLRLLIRSGTVNPEVNQVELHPLLVQDELVSFCHDNHVHVTAYSPLGSSNHVKELLANPVIRDVALRTGMTPAQTLILWSIKRGIAAIPKTARADRLGQNFEALNFEMTDRDVKQILGLDRGERFITGELWAMKGSPYTLEYLWHN